MLMLRRRRELAKMDLQFWWYYLLLLLGAVISAGGWIVEAAGLSMPVPYGVVYWICLLTGTLIMLAVQIFAGPKIAVTYALRYEHYLQTPPPEPKPRHTMPQPAPEDLPWQY
jgi:hypothetical protein